MLILEEVLLKNLTKGQIIDKNLTDFKRPGDGIPPNKYKELLGKIKRHINYDELILFDNIE